MVRGTVGVCSMVVFSADASELAAGELRPEKVQAVAQAIADDGCAALKPSHFHPIDRSSPRILDSNSLTFVYSF